jgi:tetratricopeptide (TPR) repeat protein
VLATHPTEPLSLRYLAWLEEQRGNLPAAAGYLEALLRSSQSKAAALTDVHVSLGRVYNNLDRFQDTVSLLQPLYDKADDSRKIQALTLLSEAEISLHHGDKAKEYISMLQKKADAEAPELIFLRALLARENKQYDEAIGLFNRLIEKKPENSYIVYYQVAQTYFEAGKIQSSIEFLDKAAAAAPPPLVPSILNGLTALLLNQKKGDEAVVKIEASIQKHPNIPELPLLLANVQQAMGHPDRALAILEPLMAKQPGYMPAYYLASDVARNNKDLAKAKSFLQQAQKSAAFDALGWMKLVSLLVEEKNFAAAEDALKTAVKANPESEELGFELASLYETQDMEKAANTQYRTILERHPDYVPALNNLAVNLMDEDLPKALVLIEKAYSIDGENPNVLASYGRIALQGGRTEKAIPLLEKSVGLAPKEVEFRNYLAAAYLKSGAKDKAKAVLEQTITLPLSEHERQEIQKVIGQIQKGQKVEVSALTHHHHH